MGLIRIGKKWLNKTVHYEVSNKVLKLSGFTNILKATNAWEKATPLKFRRLAGQWVPNHIFFVFSLESFATGRCTSAVGMQGGRQLIKCAPPFNLGTLIHEIGHAIGLYHEHQRPDRDEVVKLLPGFSLNVDFRKKRPLRALPVGNYDCFSIMHYPASRFSTVSRTGCGITGLGLI